MNKKQIKTGATMTPVCNSNGGYMMKKMVVLFGICACVVYLVALAVGCEESDDSSSLDKINANLNYIQQLDNEETIMLEAVLPQLSEWLESIPDDALEMLGFEDRFEFDSADLGQPYKMFLVDPDGTIRPIDYWRIPVLIDGEFRVVFNVKKESGKYVGYSIGSKEFAKDIASMETDVSVQYEKISKRSLVVDNQNSASFAVFNDDPRKSVNEKEIKIHPFPSAKMAYGSKIKDIKSKITVNANKNHTILSLEQFKTLFRK